MKSMIAAIAVLATAGCTVSLGRDAAETTTTTTTEATTTTTTAAPTTTTTTTTTVPPLGTDPAYQAALDYLNGYCYTDCSRIDPDTLDEYINRSPGMDLNIATLALAEFSYADLEDVCTEFWAKSDQQLIDEYYWDVDVDPNAILATLWFTCDS